MFKQYIIIGNLKVSHIISDTLLYIKITNFNLFTFISIHYYILMKCNNYKKINL